VFADVVRQHRDAVLGCCAERLWPDADAAVAAACDVLIAARLVMADSAKLARPDRLRGWLLGIAANDGLTPGLPARIDDINWEAVHAHVAADVPDMRESPTRRASLRHWLEQIVATLPEPRQRLFDLFVVSGLDSRKAALELGTNIAEVRRLRRENRQAILRAFEVTSLAAAEGALDAPGGDAPGCGELRQILADAQHDGDPQEAARRQILVLPAALRLTVTRHLSQCGTCQGRRDDCSTRWAPELVPILAGTELNEQVMEDLHPAPELTWPRDTRGAHRRVSSVGTARTVVVRQAAAAAAGAGLLVALLLLAFVWPGFLHSTAVFVPRGSTAPSTQDPGSGGPSGIGAPRVTGTIDGAPRRNHGRQVRPGAESLLISSPPDSTGGLAGTPSSSALPPPPVQSTVPPSTPTPSAQPTSGPSPTTSPPAPSPSPSAQPTKVPAPPPPPPPPPHPPPPRRHPPPHHATAVNATAVNATAIHHAYAINVGIIHGTAAHPDAVHADRELAGTGRCVAVPASPAMRNGRCTGNPCRVLVPGRRLRGTEGYLASRWRKPKPSERVRVAVNVSNSTGAGYGFEAVAAGVW
jgi:DNA-directed RNA polymerase specialized sigma24 family protein